MKEIEWIKDAVKICCTDYLSEQEMEERFAEPGKKYEMFSEKEKNFIAQTIGEQFEPNDSIYIYSVFLRYMGNAKFAEGLMDAVLKNDFDPYTGSMLELQTYKYKKDFRWVYKKLRELHRNNIEAFNKVLQIHYPYIEPQNRNRKRIVIVTEQMLSSLHAPTRVVSNFAYILKQMGYEILLFACPCDGILPVDLWHDLYRMNSIEALEAMPMKMYYRGEEFEGYQINMEQKNMKEYHMMLAMIHAWNPMFVLDLGTVNPVVDLVSRFTTLAAWEMGIECPVSEGDILIRLEWTEERLEREYSQALEKNQTQLFMEENMPVLIDDTGTKCLRSDLELPEDRFLVAVVGNRLDWEIDDTFIAVMRRITEAAADIDFVIIGDAETAKRRLADVCFSERIYFLGYRTNLSDVYGALNLYVNPARPGGGFSAAMALIAGLPVVTLPNCDVAYNVGEEFAVADYEEMIQTVVRYASDADFYEQKASQAQHYKEKNTDAKLEKYVKKLLDGVLGLIDGREVDNACI